VVVKVFWLMIAVAVLLSDQLVVDLLVVILLVVGQIVVDQLVVMIRGCRGDIAQQPAAYVNIYLLLYCRIVNE